MSEAGSGVDASLRFEILGRLRGWRGEHELDLGPGKQRAVLAVLLLNANRPTPTAAILDAVWRDDPPENGANVVQKYVAGLRRIFEPNREPRTPWQALTLDDAGYALHVKPDRLDADVFQRNLLQAREARAHDRPAEATEHLRTALDLWRGEPLAGLHGPAFDAARERLEEDRASALEACAEIELELGHHHRLVPELVRLVAEFPMREQSRYLLILALYRSGRQAEALGAYREARRFLNEEFGVEPGERLRQLHVGILRSDPALGATAGPDEQPPSLVKAPTAEPVTPKSPEAPEATDAPAAVAAQPAPHAAPAPPPVDVGPWTPITPEPAGRPDEPPRPAQEPFGPPQPPRSYDPPRSYGAPAPPAPPGGMQPWMPRPVWVQPVPMHAPAWPVPIHRQVWLRRVVAASIPVLSFGMLTWMVMAYFAARRRSWILALVTAGYVALIVLAFTGLDGSEPEGSAMENLGVMAMLLALVGGALHGGLLVTWPRRATLPRRLDPEAIKALERRVRREQALSLVRYFPAIALELNIGRPDLPRFFDDGGLVDINTASAPVLAALPGMTAHQARQIVAHRQAQGGFGSIQDLIVWGLIAPPTAQALRETLVAIRPESAVVPHAPRTWHPGGVRPPEHL
ncbi:BTAD domain-containing putative transcriptional regulator [Actinomadura sp. HBU206391]|uniref:BTAD domain-containing putative transcriptional regulator n=1 Tax=Actinomadura sp. HBU206391 TaxID=2731692 RepID=UPI001650379D|nr:BTAD domain-containing putative transcriptional regulator [Actinomadura sp. HBU206391]MBC6460480.1 helix-hairpin-helix domain-containing protein [Actinomadura sp. HBU206391]